MSGNRPYTYVVGQVHGILDQNLGKNLGKNLALTDWLIAMCGEGGVKFRIRWVGAKSRDRKHMSLPFLSHVVGP